VGFLYNPGYGLLVWPRTISKWCDF